MTARERRVRQAEPLDAPGGPYYPRWNGTDDIACTDTRTGPAERRVDQELRELVKRIEAELSPTPTRRIALALRRPTVTEAELAMAMRAAAIEAENDTDTRFVPWEGMRASSRDAWRAAARVAVERLK